MALSPGLRLPETYRVPKPWGCGGGGRLDPETPVVEALVKFRPLGSPQGPPLPISVRLMSVSVLPL